MYRLRTLFVGFAGVCTSDLRGEVSVVERKHMRLYVVNKDDLRVQWEGIGSLQGHDIVNRQGKVDWSAGPSDLVITPTGEMEEPEPGSWLLVRGSDGSAFFFCPKRKEAGYVYLSREDVDTRADESEVDCFVAHIEGDTRWFRQIDPTTVTDQAFAAEECLTYEEDGERSSDDSFGPASTIIS